MSEGDGIEDAFDTSLRTGLAVASQLAEKTMRMLEDLARQREAASREEARELRNRFEGEQLVARAELAPVHEPSWWDSAAAADISRVHETSTIWAQHDPDAVKAAERIRLEVQERYGIDVDRPGADTASVREALLRAEEERAESESERRKATADEAEAANLIGLADRMDQERARDQVGAEAHYSDAEQLWDSAERRDERARDLDQAGVPAETVKAWKIADVDNAKPPSDAVRQLPKAGTKVRKFTASTGREAQRSRGR